MRLFPKLSRRIRLVLLGVGIGGVSLMLLGLGLWSLLDTLFPFPIEELYQHQARQSLLVRDQEGAVLGARVNAEDNWHFPLQPDEISPWLRQATVAVEDKRFYRHGGVDFIAVGRAVLSNLRRGRVVSGASTITMQVVRIIHPRPRNLRSKLIETFRAWQLEGLLTKDEILTVYLNHAPYGRNFVGVKAAAWRYFNKAPLQLNCGEAALLAGLPQAPSWRDPLFNPASARDRRRQVLAAMQRNGYISASQFKRETGRPLQSITLTSLPEPSHLCDLVQNRIGRNGEFRTTVNARIQAALGEVLQRVAPVLRGQGIDSLAAVIISVPDSSLLGLISSPAHRALPDGQVNRSLTRRQPGSTLKPFVYAAAFDRGLADPQMLLQDTPRNWGGYSPRNYDRVYRGRISAREALRQSINVPAVDLLNRVGGRRMYDLLGKAGISFLQPYEKLGLSLALGTGEVRLIDLANAYAALARGGLYRPLQFLTESDFGEPRRLFSEAASYLTLECLQDEGYSESGPDANSRIRAAFKTGTSWDYRDAWCIYLTPDYAVGVWLGNASGAPNTALVGLEAAVPVARLILGELYPQGNIPVWPVPENVQCHQYCAQSGKLAGMHCQARMAGHYVTGRRSMIPCRHSDLPGAAIKPLLASKAGPVILSPLDEAEYILLDNPPPGGQKLAFRARSTPGRLYWFLNGSRVSSASESLTWSPEPGDYELVCVTAAGDAASCTFRVRRESTSRLSRTLRPHQIIQKKFLQVNFVE